MAERGAVTDAVALPDGESELLAETVTDAVAAATEDVAETDGHGDADATPDADSVVRLKDALTLGDTVHVPLAFDDTDGELLAEPVGQPELEALAQLEGDRVRETVGDTVFDSEEVGDIESESVVVCDPEPEAQVEPVSVGDTEDETELDGEGVNEFVVVAGARWLVVGVTLTDVDVE